MTFLWITLILIWLIMIVSAVLIYRSLTKSKTYEQMLRHCGSEADAFPQFNGMTEEEIDYKIWCDDNYDKIRNI